MASITVRVRDSEGEEVEVKIDANEQTDSGTITVDGEETELTELKKGRDGSRVTGKTEHWAVPGKINVTITITCDDHGGTIRILAVDRDGKVRKDETYTISHEEQDRLVDWLKGLKIPVLPAPAGMMGADTQMSNALKGVREALPEIERALSGRGAGWIPRGRELELFSSGARVRLTSPAETGTGTAPVMLTIEPVLAGAAALEHRLAGLENMLRVGLKAPRGAVAAGPTSAGTSFDFEHCDHIYSNTDNTDVVIELQIHNPGSGTLVMDVDGNNVAEIPAGKTQIVRVRIPAGKTLHAGGSGQVQR